MNTKLLIACAAALAAFLPNSAMAEATYIPATPEKEARLRESQLDYESSLMSCLSEYATAVYNRRKVCEGDIFPALKGAPVAEAKKFVISYIKEHPEEVNDAGYQDCETGSPLTTAVYIGDVELVRLLLEHGAIPYQPGNNGDFCTCPSREVRKLIDEARRQWPEVDIRFKPFEKLRLSGK